MISTFPSVLLFAGAIWASYALAGFYGVALSASAMMATTAMQLAIDAFGPIADNAGGIAEMSEQDPIVRERTDILDSVGNTTAATGKGFAIASAALTSLALFAAYVTFTGIDGINIFKAPVLAMLFVGGMVPVVFSALAMNAVGKAAMEMVYEVRRQFKEIAGIMEGSGKPEYDKCVAISTKASLKEMMLPGLLTIGFPLIIALVPLLFGMDKLAIAEMLGGYMAGVTVSGVLWAIFQNNAGGAWDNAKKSFEAGVEINGEMTYKGSDAHKAAVTGDTVGDPFKDTSGPSMNILIKLTCLIGLVIAPILGGHTGDDHHLDKQGLELHSDHGHSHEIEKKVLKFIGADGKEVVVEETIENGVKSVKLISGDLASLSDTTLLKIKKQGLDLSSLLGDKWNSLKEGAFGILDWFKTKLPSGAEINIPKGSLEENFMNYLGEVAEDDSKLDKDKIFLFDRLLFETGSSNLKADSKVQLDNVAIILKEYPQANVVLGGHTDNTGSADGNLSLSQKRAEAVKAQLVEKGVPETIVRAKGFGQEKPIGDNNTEEGRQQNRRIDLAVEAWK